MARTRDFEPTNTDHDKGPITAQAVPRVVHQVWVQGDPEGEPAELMRKVHLTCEMEGWEYVRWRAVGGAIVNDRNEVLEQASPLFEAMALRCANVSTQSDLMRFLILDALGGLYLDADVDLFKLPEGMVGA